MVAWNWGRWEREGQLTNLGFLFGVKTDQELLVMIVHTKKPPPNCKV